MNYDVLNEIWSSQIPPQDKTSLDCKGDLETTLNSKGPIIFVKGRPNNILQSEKLVQKQKVDQSASNKDKGQQPLRCFNYSEARNYPSWKLWAL